MGNGRLKAAEQEQNRLDALLQLDLLDTPASESFDRITRMAAQIFSLPIAAVSLTDSDRQVVQVTLRRRALLDPTRAGTLR